MATINKQMKTFNVPNGNDTVCYEIVDASVRDNLVKVSETQPADDVNKLWIHDGEVEEYTIPTIDEFNNLSSEFDDMRTATLSDLGKALIVKDVEDGKVTEWEFGEAGGGISATAANLLLTILDEGVYGSDQSANIELLRKALLDIEPVSISAVLDCTPYVGLHYSDLKFIVTATFDDASTLVVDNYSILTPGSVTSGSNTVTVRFRFTTCEATFTASSVQTYTITNNLTNISTSNPAYLIETGERYAAELSLPDTEHYISAYSVTMGGTDITSTAYNNGNIVIDQVTGNVVITVTASEYTYLDPLITKRPYTNQADNTARLYSDKYATLVANIAYYHVGKVTEYPAKADCDLFWEITNTSESTVSFDSANRLGFGMISGSESEYVNNDAIAYWQAIDNVSHSLAPGESISGTYTLKAGWQLILTTTVQNNEALSERIRGNFVAETFNDYDLLATLNNSTTDFPNISGGYKTTNFYSDNGQTLLNSAAGWFPKISDELGQAEYDILFRKRRLVATLNNNDNDKKYIGFIDFDDSQSTWQSNYASMMDYGVYSYNVWVSGRIKATNSGMVLISSRRMYYENDVIEIYIKEVTE